MDEASQEMRDDLRGLLVRVVKAALVGEGPAFDVWRREAEALQPQVTERAASGLRPSPGLDAVWSQAVQEAEADEAVQRLETSSPALPRPCPLTLDDLIGEGFSFTAVAEKVRVSAATG